MVRHSLDRSRRLENSFRARLFHQTRIGSVPSPLSPLNNKENEQPANFTPRHNTTNVDNNELPSPAPFRWNLLTLEEKDREIECLKDRICELESENDDLRCKNMQTSLLLEAERKHVDVYEAQSSTIVCSFNIATFIILIIISVLTQYSVYYIDLYIICFCQCAYH